MVGCSIWEYDVHGQVPVGIFNWSYVLQFMRTLPYNSMDIKIHKEAGQK